jgi:hypothetical protein
MAYGKKPMKKAKKMSYKSEMAPGKISPRKRMAMAIRKK